MQSHSDIRLGTMAGKSERTPEYIAATAGLGFECFQINFWQRLPDGYPLTRMAKDVHRVLDGAGHGQTVSSLGMFGNRDGWTGRRLCRGGDGEREAEPVGVASTPPHPVTWPV